MMEEQQRQGIICLLTIHGIGFQVAPDTDHEDPSKRVFHGYADALHERLSQRLGAPFLSDDPLRQQYRTRPGEAGAIYVHSHWPAESYDIEEGLGRLGAWRTERRTGAGEIEATSERARLAEPGARVAHVALVYAHPQRGTLQHLGSLADTTVRVLVSHLRYGSPFAIGRMIFRSLWALARQRPTLPQGPTSMHVREQNAGEKSPGAWSVIRALEADLSTYVSRNDVREDVRGFVRQVLLRLAARADVDGIVVNAHSQGTTVAFDAIRSLPPLAATKVRYLVTSGSPLRKYASLFYWGTDVGSVARLDGWTNFWDAVDPVADPLGPAAWRPGSDHVTDDGRTLFRSFSPDDATDHTFSVIDCRVDNVAKSAGDGLRAHNYWDNEDEVVGPLSEILAHVAKSEPLVTAVGPSKSASLVAP